MALAVAALGIATASQYLFGWSLGIDEAVLRDPAALLAVHRAPGRMSPYSAFAFAAIGLALAGLPQAALQRPVRAMAALVTLIGSVALVGYLWNGEPVNDDPPMPMVSVHSALAFLLLGVGTWLASRRLHPWVEPSALTRSSIELKIAGGLGLALLLLVVGGGRHPPCRGGCRALGTIGGAPARRALASEPVLRGGGRRRIGRECLPVDRQAFLQGRLRRSPRRVARSGQGARRPGGGQPRPKREAGGLAGTEAAPLDLAGAVRRGARRGAAGGCARSAGHRRGRIRDG